VLFALCVAQMNRLTEPWTRNRPSWRRGGKRKAKITI